MAKLALPPEDAGRIGAAYERSRKRLAAVILPLCAKAVGSSDTAELIGIDTCTHVIVDLERKSRTDGGKLSMDLLFDVRTGVTPEPDGEALKALSPAMQAMLTLTGESKRFERDLAETYGAEEAARLTYADGMCMGKSTWGGLSEPAKAPGKNGP